MTSISGKEQGFWEPSRWYGAEVIHALAGCLILYASQCERISALWTVWILFGCVTAIKEIIDCTGFESDSWQSSLVDWSFYQTGALAGVLAFHWFWIGASLEIVTVLVIWAIDLWDHAHLKVNGQWLPWRNALKLKNINFPWKLPSE